MYLVVVLNPDDTEVDDEKVSYYQGDGAIVFDRHRLGHLHKNRRTAVAAKEELESLFPHAVYRIINLNRSKLADLEFGIIKE